MKKKDIITLIISSLVIIGSVYFLFTINKPKKVEVKVEPPKEEFTGNLDNYKQTLDKLYKLNDYGEANLENIGRANPFAPL